MRNPNPPGTPIDMVRMRNWVSEFSSYHRCGITEGRIERWLHQFKATDQDLAARILDAVEYISDERISASFRAALSCLPGWNIDESTRLGKWFFVSFATSAGESGDSMLHNFRLANNLAGKKYNDLFIHPRDLLLASPSEDDTVVFIDDFSGSGSQVCDDAWPTIEELLPYNPNMFLVLIAATERAIGRISAETPMIPHTNIRLNDGDDVFSTSCSHFNANEKETILEYCKRANKDNPKGFGDCGLVIVFSHSCPNNSIPILHSPGRWEGLFRRFS